MGPEDLPGAVSPVPIPSLALKEPVRQHFFSKHDNRTSFDKVSAWEEAPTGAERAGRVREGFPGRAGTQVLWFPLPACLTDCASGPGPLPF